MGIDDEIARGEIGNDWERRYRSTMDLLTEAQRELATASAEVLKLRNERHLDNVDLVHAYDMGRDKERAAVLELLRNDMVGYCACCGQSASDLDYHIDIIERGEHRREEEK
jgi:hypothetical protein